MGLRLCGVPAALYTYMVYIVSLTANRVRFADGRLSRRLNFLSCTKRGHLYESRPRRDKNRELMAMSSVAVYVVAGHSLSISV